MDRGFRLSTTLFKRRRNVRPSAGGNAPREHNVRIGRRRGGGRWNWCPSLFDLHGLVDNWGYHTQPTHPISYIPYIAYIRTCILLRPYQLTAASFYKKTPKRPPPEGSFPRLFAILLLHCAYHGRAISLLLEVLPQNRSPRTPPQFPTSRKPLA